MCRYAAPTYDFDIGWDFQKESLCRSLRHNRSTQVVFTGGFYRRS